MDELAKKFLEALGRELGFVPQATEDGLVPLQFGEQRALLHFQGGDTLVLYAEIGRPAAPRRMELLAHFMARNFLMAEAGAAVFSYDVHDNMLGMNMRLDMHALDAPVFLQSVDAFLGMAGKNAGLLAKMNESPASARIGPRGSGEAESATGGVGAFVRA